MAKTSTETVQYELMLLLFPDLGEKTVKEELDNLRSYIKDSGGKILNEDIFGVRDLAYVIKKQDRAFYAVLNFTLPPEKVKEMEKDFNIKQAVMRHLLLKTPKYYEFRTLAEYDEIAEKEEAERLREKEEKEANKSGKENKRNERVKFERKSENTRTAVQPPMKTDKKEVERKIDSLVDDPDIVI